MEKYEEFIIEVSNLRDAEKNVIKQKDKINTILEKFLLFVNADTKPIKVISWEIIDGGEILINDMWEENLNLSKHIGIKIKLSSVDHFIQYQLNK